MRLGDIELRKLIGDSSDFEIIKWEPNQYFGMENNYAKIDEHTYSDGISRISETCFSNPEYCYVLSFIRKGIPEFIGGRPMDLRGEYELRSFLWMLRKGISKSLRYKVKDCN